MHAIEGMHTLTRNITHAHTHLLVHAHYTISSLNMDTLSGSVGVLVSADATKKRKRDEGDVASTSAQSNAKEAPVAESTIEATEVRACLIFRDKYD